MVALPVLIAVHTFVVHTVASGSAWCARIADGIWGVPFRNKCENWHISDAMTSMNISFPDPLKAYVEDRVASSDFGTPSEFVRNLIRQDKEQRRALI